MRSAPALQRLDAEQAAPRCPTPKRPCESSTTSSKSLCGVQPPHPALRGSLFVSVCPRSSNRQAERTGPIRAVGPSSGAFRGPAEVRGSVRRSSR